MLVALTVPFFLGCRHEPPPRRPPSDTETVDTSSPTDSTTTDTTPTSRPPLSNVLMISIDTTRRDHVDRYAAPAATRTPFLAQLLAEGIALDDHQQCSDWTFASTSCTLEGRLNEDTGWVAKLMGATPVPAGRRTLAVRLGELGWNTILVNSNGWITQDWNNAQGYETYARETTADSATLLGKGRDLLDEVVATTEGPWLLHVHLVQAHPPYTPPDPYDDAEEALAPIPWDLDTQTGQYSAAAEWPTMTPAEQDLLVAHLEARYTGELQLQDDQFASWFGEMDAAGYLDGTLVVFWTDHGEQFFEHGNQSHAWSLGGEETDAVAGFWAKGLAPQAITSPTHGVDVLPTVLDLLGLPADDALEGYVVGTAPADRPRFSATVARLGPEVSVVKGGWKLMYDFDGTVRLWNRATDPREQTDLFDPQDPTALELWSLLLPRIALVQALTPEWPIVWPPDLPHD